MPFLKSQQHCIKRRLFMKKILGFAVIIICTLLLLPLTSLKSTSNKAIATVSPIKDTMDTAKKQETFMLCNTSTNDVKEISTQEYIFGVVAAEMPALYEEEALKAQAVAAYTFACYRKNKNIDKDYDITDDHLSDQSFITLEEATARWGDNAQVYTEKINKAISEVQDYMITYNDEPILAVYHAISFGNTEDSKNVWGGDYPYLKSVESYGDKLSEGYISTLTVPEEKFKETLSSKVEFIGSPQDFLGKINRTDAGGVKDIKICDNEVSGSEIRELFGLRSSNFEIEYKDGNFNFTVYGYGHAVGLSQNGADYMAKQGSDFKEILNHYYKNCKIEKIE